MDRQNLIIGVIAVVVLVAVGAFYFWPEGVEQAANVTTEPAATAEGGGTAPTADESATDDAQSGGY